jgi:hypothetical protein
MRKLLDTILVIPLIAALGYLLYAAQRDGELFCGRVQTMKAVSAPSQKAPEIFVPQPSQSVKLLPTPALTKIATPQPQYTGTATTGAPTESTVELQK